MTPLPPLYDPPTLLEVVLVFFMLACVAVSAISAVIAIVVGFLERKERNMEILKSERGAVVTVVIIAGIAVGVATLVANNYFWHGNISVACTMMGLPLGSC